MEHKNQMTNLKHLLALGILLSSLFITSCENEATAQKSMEQIMKEDGVPVSTKSIEYNGFKKKLSYFAQLEGIKQMTKGTGIGGRVAKINFQVGSMVKENAVVVEFPTDMPGLQYHQAKIGFENTEKTYKRIQALYASGDASKQQLDDIETKYNVDKETLQNIKDLLFLDAPFDGVITKLYVNEGNNVRGDDPLFTIAQLDRMLAKVWVSDKEINYLKKGMKVSTNVNGKVYTGTINEISLSADLSHQAFYVEVVFNNPSRELKSGTTLEIEVIIYEKSKAISIPRNLIQKDDEGIFVYIESQGKAKKSYIKTGEESGMDIEILEGLNVGDNLIVKGSTLLSNASKVRVVN